VLPASSCQKINKDGGRAEDADVVVRTKILLRIDCFYASIEIGESKCCCVIKWRYLGYQWVGSVTNLPITQWRLVKWQKIITSHVN